MAQSEQLDLGPLRLKPAGVLDLAVEDRDGKRITTFEVLCDGRRIPGYTFEQLPEGRVRLHKLSLGRVTVRVSAPGYRERELTVELVPGTPAEARAILER